MTKKQERSRTYPLRSLLVERGFCASDREAERWIMAGKVLVEGQRVDKAGVKIPACADLRIIGRQRYASRGGYKLAAALDAFGVDITGRVAVDCGASTGGFTDCLLQRGAAQVYAVDAGFGQLVGRLQVHPCIRNLERTNLSDLVSLTLDPPPTLITLDLSYLSLTKALPLAARLLVEGEVLALFKPLFEVESPTARRTGKIEDVALLVAALQQVLEVGEAAGLLPVNLAKLALKPRHGVHELFLHFVRRPGAVACAYGTTALLEVLQSAGIGSAEEA